MKILVTGSAGFIGYHISKELIQNGHEVIGLDNINDYYDVDLKFARLSELGIERGKAEKFDQISKSVLFPNQFTFTRKNIEDKKSLSKIFELRDIDIVCHMAAQAGVRYSIENPDVYITSNVVGFSNILECCRHHKVKHLVYASSSSVYGLNKKVPFEVSDNVDYPISIYAATKKSNELMAHAYSHLYGFRCTGLRFFTVYGPWGRPDMALFLFTKSILNGEPIDVFNFGKMERDFTYISDIVEGVLKIMETPFNTKKQDRILYNVYNIGNNSSVKLLTFIEELEKCLGVKATKNMLPKQPGDVERTWANVDQLIQDYNYRPSTSISSGIEQFVQWYKSYYKVGKPADIL